MMRNQPNTITPEDITKHFDDIVKSAQKINDLLLGNRSHVGEAIKANARATINTTNAARFGVQAILLLNAEQAARIANLEKQVQTATSDEMLAIRSVIHLHDAKHERFEWCGDALDEIEELLRKMESDSELVALLFDILRRWEYDEKAGHEDVAFAYLNELRAALGMPPGRYPHSDDEDEDFEEDDEELEPEEVEQG